MKKPKVIDPPETIYLQIGEIDEDVKWADEWACGEVTWCADRQFDCDVEYRLVKRKKKQRN
jgi:hypothetical protein